jgi:hypothetical protein
MLGSTLAVLFSARPDLLTNGNFDAGSAAWSVINADVTHIVTFAGGTLRFQSDTTSPALTVEQAAGLVVGGRYAIETWCSSYTSGSIKNDNALGAVPIADGPGYKKAFIIANSMFFNFTRNSTNVDLTLDRIKVTAA